MAKTNLGMPLGCPLPTYKMEGGGERRPRSGAPIGGVQLGFPILVGVPFLFQEGERGEEVEEKEVRVGGSRPLP